MYAPCVHHEEPLSLDIIPNPNSFQTLPDPSRPLVFPDHSKLCHMTSRSRALHPLQTNNHTIYLCPANPNPSQSLFILLSYNNIHSNPQIMSFSSSVLPNIFWYRSQFLFYLRYLCQTLDNSIDHLYLRYLRIAQN